MAFDDMDIDYEDEEGEGAPAEESGNRTFIIIAAVLGAIMLLTLFCIAIYAFVMLPRQRANNQAQIAQATESARQLTAVAISAKQTNDASQWTATPTITATPAPATPTPTRTSVLVLPSPTSGTPEIDPRTATVAALLTQAAGNLTLTPISPTPSSMPTTGFAEDMGVPGLLALAVVFVVVIFLARRFRTAG